MNTNDDSFVEQFIMIILNGSSKKKLEKKYFNNVKNKVIKAKLNSARY